MDKRKEDQMDLLSADSATSSSSHAARNSKVNAQSMAARQRAIFPSPNFLAAIATSIGL